MAEFRWPLMVDNVTRKDLDCVINYLSQENPRLTQGEQVKKFEREFANWLGVEHAIFVNSGSSANLLTLTALKHEFPEGGEVIVPPLTWSSDIMSILHTGFTPRFVDIDLRTLAMRNEDVLEVLNNHTRAVFITHVLGYDGFLEGPPCAGWNPSTCWLIEDACESHGATHNGRKLGTFGHASNFSMYYGHALTCGSEGGMVCTNDWHLNATLRMLRSHGLTRENPYVSERSRHAFDFPDLNHEFIFAFPSYNMRGDEIRALFGRSHLMRLDDEIALRNRNLHLFLDNLDSNKYFTDFITKGCSNYALTLMLRNPDDNLRSNVISCLNILGIEYRRGMSGGGNQLRQPYLQNRGLPKPEEFPQSEHVHFYGFYIGNYPSLNSDWILELCEELNKLG